MENFCGGGKFPKFPHCGLPSIFFSNQCRINVFSKKLLLRNFCDKMVVVYVHSMYVAKLNFFHKIYFTAKKEFYGLGKVTQALHCSITMYQTVLQELRGNLLASKIVLIVRVDKSMSGFNMDHIQLSMRRPLLNFQQVTTTENAVTWNG